MIPSDINNLIINYLDKKDRLNYRITNKKNKDDVNNIIICEKQVQLNNLVKKNINLEQIPFRYIVKHIHKIINSVFVRYSDG